MVRDSKKAVRLWSRFCILCFCAPAFCEALFVTPLCFWIPLRICVIYLCMSNSDQNSVWYASARLILISNLSDEFLNIWLWYESVWYISVCPPLITNLSGIRLHIWPWLQICLVYMSIRLTLISNLFDKSPCVWLWLQIRLIYLCMSGSDFETA